MTQKILASHRSIIFLHGTPPDKSLLALINTNMPIIAADGAAENAYRTGLAPHYIVGDGDSYTRPPKPQHRLSKDEPQIITIADQDTTDFEKCLSFAKQANLLPCLILGISGGEIDHTLGNMRALLKHARESNLYFLDTYVKKNSDTIGIKLGIPIGAGQKLVLHVRPKSMVSIVHFDDTLMQTHGLKWELNNHLFSPDGILGVRNECISSRVEFEAKKGGALLIFDINE